MVATLEDFSFVAAHGERAGAVQADVVEGADRLARLWIIDHHDRIPRHVGVDSVAGLLELVHMADVLPRLRKDHVLIGFMVARIRVPTGGDREGARQRVHGQDFGRQIGQVHQICSRRRDRLLRHVHGCASDEIRGGRGCHTGTPRVDD